MEDVVKHAEAFETALQDHASLQDASDAMAVRTSQYQRQKLPTRQAPCSGCGSLSHGSKDRSSKCPAWGKTCHNCKLSNHFSKVCRKPKSETAEALLAHVTYDEKSKAFRPTAEITEINAKLTPTSNTTKPTPTSMKIFPDSGASICLGGPQHLNKLKLNKQSLTPCNKLVRAVGGSTLHCSGWLPMTFTIDNHTTT
eukprot:TCONS_00027626-protein